MKFWVIAYVHEEDVWYDLEKQKESHILRETCFLPTKSLARQLIDEELSTDYVPQELTLDTLSEQGSWSYTFQPLLESKKNEWSFPLTK